MSENIITIDKVSKDLRKKLDKDKEFKFECEVIDDKIRLGLKEINYYSPYYFENFFTKEVLDKKNSVFRQCIDLNEVQGHLIRLFKDKVSLEYAENRENINLIFTMFTMSGTTLVVFELEKKTMEEKDDGLNFLYKIEKTNYDLMDKILKACKEAKNEKCSLDIIKYITENKESLIKNF